MKFKIAYCNDCFKQYENVMSMYGEKCTCGADLELAEKTIRAGEYETIRPWGVNITRLER